MDPLAGEVHYFDSAWVIQGDPEKPSQDEGDDPDMLEVIQFFQERQEGPERAEQEQPATEDFLPYTQSDMVRLNEYTEFARSKYGYVFGMGPKGVGYYRDRGGSGLKAGRQVWSDKGYLA